MHQFAIISFLWICSALLSAAEPQQVCTLQAPLSTYAYADGRIDTDAQAIQAQIHIPDDAPADLGVGAFIKDDDGNWFQLPYQAQLHPGHQHLHFSLAQQEAWQSEPGLSFWDPYHQHLAHEYGLYFWSASESRSAITIHEIRSVVSSSVPPEKTYTLQDINWDHYQAEQQRIFYQTGQRFEVRCRLDPMPINPYDDGQCKLELLIREPGSEHDLVFQGFYKQDIAFSDRGDDEVSQRNGKAYFAARFRPMKPGAYQAHIRATWTDADQESNSRSYALPPMIVDGPVSDPYVRVDAADPRFLSVGTGSREFIWPIGINIRSVTDIRGTKRTKSNPTPDRGIFSYKAYIDRYANAGATNIELWLSSWNFALEWLNEWPGFHGVGAYHEANAERIDQVLDYAWSRGMRVIFVINNHGQASTSADAEWEHSPYNKRNGGPIHQAGEMFKNEEAIALQQRHRRYLVARYADHPAILCWKLWTEMNLTRGSRPNLKNWHKQAFDDFHRLDFYYRHPCTSHWSGDYNVPDRELVKLPEMDMIAIDAYHRGRFLPQLLNHSTLHEHRGLARFEKPVVVTEFGGNWDACPLPQLQAEHACGFWAALMSGHASSPHLWWFEWVDQENLWLPYRAMNRFIQGEDLRNPKARSVKLDLRNKDDQQIGKDIWSRAWAMPGYILGYCVDFEWADKGTSQALHQQLSIVISKQTRAGTLLLEWWDPQTGNIIGKHTFEHAGGELRIQLPDFRRHLAFKLKRPDEQE